MFISIRWRVLLFTFVALLITMGLVTSIAIFNQFQTHQYDIAIHSDRSQKIVESLLNKQQESLITLAHVLSNVVTVGKDAETDIDETFWTDLKINSYINFLSIYDQNETLVRQFTDEMLLSDSKQLELTVRTRINNQMEPMTESFLFCDIGCLQISIEPIITRSGLVHYFVVGKSLSEIVSSFSQYTTSELGILLPYSKEMGINDNLLPYWQLRVWSLSDFNKTIEEIRFFSENHGYGESPQKCQFQQQTLSVRSHLVDRDQFGLSPVFISVMNTTEASLELKQNILDVLFFGGLLLVFVLFILYLLMLKPIKRLMNISNALDTVGYLDFERSKAMLGNVENHQQKDEVEMLERNTYKVAGALQSYKRQIEENNISLSQQLVMIERSQAFLRRLIDTSELFVITQTFKGEVLLKNKKAEVLFSNTDSSFFSALSVEDKFSFFDDLRALQSNMEHTIFTDSVVKNQQGDSWTVQWVHSTIIDDTGNRVILSVGTDITQRQQAESKLNWLVRHDPLTKIPNRFAFQEKIDAYCDEGVHFGLVFLDVNRFKKVNDLFGHAVGDQVLIDLATKLTDATSKSDFSSRLAGDEFVIIIPGIQLRELAPLLGKLSDKLIGQLDIGEGQTVEYSTTMGAAYYPTHAKDSETLLIHADMAMFHAKQNYNKPYHVFSFEDDYLEEMKLEHKIIKSINQGLDEDRFVLQFQPIQSISGTKVEHFEVLLRLKDDLGNLVLPDKFIPIAEKTGLITKVDEWVITQSAFAVTEHLRLHPDTNIKVSINISATSLQQENFHLLMLEVLARYSLSTEHIIIEITETAFIEDFKQTLINVESLVSHGISIALDDFGVGYSSFKYLKMMPLTFVKLDGSYIQNLLDNEDNQVFVESMAKMAKGFGMQTIAEFVEDETTLIKLNTLGVDFVQGNYIGLPDFQFKQ